jgi:hypothetical protein
MPIRLLLERDYLFAPDDVGALVAAFEQALTALGLTDRTDPATTLVAKTIIDLAKQGERDPRRLCEAAVKSLSK